MNRVGEIDIRCFFTASLKKDWFKRILVSANPVFLPGGWSPYIVKVKKYSLLAVSLLIANCLQVNYLMAAEAETRFHYSMLSLLANFAAHTVRVSSGEFGWS